MKLCKLPAGEIGLGVAAVCALLLGVCSPADAKTKLRSPRDIAGFWQVYPLSFSFDPSLQPGAIQKVALQPAYDARYRSRLELKNKSEAEGKPVAEPLTYCIPGGMPSSMAAVFPMEIVVTSKTVYIIPEGVDPMRRIFLDGRSFPPLDDLSPTFEGLSIGRWEGNTLVVETTGVKTSTDLEYVPHSDAMRINERIRLLDDDTLEDVFTITDPKAFLGPWVITKLFKDYNTITTMDRGGIKGMDPGTYPDHKAAELEPNEMVCTENNRNLPGADGVQGYDLGNKPPQDAVHQTEQSK